MFNSYVTNYQRVNVTLKEAMRSFQARTSVVGAEFTGSRSRLRRGFQDVVFGSFYGQNVDTRWIYIYIYSFEMLENLSMVWFFFGQ